MILRSGNSDSECALDSLTINWHGIRAEYKKIWTDFPSIAKPFGVALSNRQLSALAHLLIAMDLIDSAVDRETEPLTRHALCRSIIGWMQQQADDDEISDTLDVQRLAPLRQVIFGQDITKRFLASAGRVFRASENKRNAASHSVLIRNLIEEGQAAAEMTILILSSNTNAPFNDFLQRIMRIGTIVDTLLDATDDYQNNVLPLNPDSWFRWRLCAAVARQLPGLMWGFPDRRLLWRYCWSYTRVEKTQS